MALVAEHAAASGGEQRPQLAVIVRRALVGGDRAEGEIGIERVHALRKGIAIVGGVGELRDLPQEVLQVRPVVAAHPLQGVRHGKYAAARALQAVLLQAGGLSDVIPAALAVDVNAVARQQIVRALRHGLHLRRAEEDTQPVRRKLDGAAHRNVLRDGQRGSCSVRLRHVQHVQAGDADLVQRHRQRERFLRRKHTSVRRDFNLICKYDRPARAGVVLHGLLGHGLHRQLSAEGHPARDDHAVLGEHLLHALLFDGRLVLPGHVRLHGRRFLQADAVRTRPLAAVLQHGVDAEPVRFLGIIGDGQRHAGRITFELRKRLLSAFPAVGPDFHPVAHRVAVKFPAEHELLRIRGVDDDQLPRVRIVAPALLHHQLRLRRVAAQLRLGGDGHRIAPRIRFLQLRRGRILRESFPCSLHERHALRGRTFFICELRFRRSGGRAQQHRQRRQQRKRLFPFSHRRPPNFMLQQCHFYIVNI